MSRKSAIRQSKRARKKVWNMLSEDAKIAANLHKAIKFLGPEDTKKARSLCGWFTSKGFLTTKQKLLASHLLGVSKESKLGDEATAPYFVYVISDGDNIKIGYSKSPRGRLKALQTANSSQLKILRAFQVQGQAAALAHEKTLHSKFKKQRIRGEWFSGDILEQVVEHFEYHINLLQEMEVDTEILRDIGVLDEINLTGATK